MIRVFLADDQRLVRSAFAMMVGAQPDMTVVGEAADGSEAVELVPSSGADVVLMDIRMPHVDGVEATKTLAGQGKTKIIILTTFDTDEYAFAALRAGASGFLIKDGSPEELLEAIRVVHRGDAVVAPTTTRRLLDQVVNMLPKDEPEPDPLTNREREVLREIATAASNAEIAQRLGLSEGTVKIHVSSILNKLGLRDRIQAVIWAYEHNVR